MFDISLILRGCYKIRIKKTLNILLLAIWLVALIPRIANAEWIKNGDPSDVSSQSEWRYKEGNSYVKNGWKNIDGKWYHFYSDCMSIGWVYENHKNYFCDTETGVMVTGWKKIHELWYYFFSDGSMAFDTVIDGYKLGKLGACIKNNAINKELIGVWYEKDNKNNKMIITEKTINENPYFILSDDLKEVEIQYNDGGAEIYLMSASNGEMLLMYFNQYRGWHSGGMHKYIKES